MNSILRLLKCCVIVIIIATIWIIALTAITQEIYAEEIASGTCGENIEWVHRDGFLVGL